MCKSLIIFILSWSSS